SSLRRRRRATAHVPASRRGDRLPRPRAELVRAGVRARARQPDAGRAPARAPSRPDTLSHAQVRSVQGDDEANGAAQMKTRKRQPPRPKSKPKTKTNRAAPARPATQTNNAKGLRTRHGRERTESFPIVGIGASAGGLDALERFFDHMPASSGMAFVVVTHQHAGHTSLMPELIAKHTPMPVSEVTRTTRVEPNQVYLTTPGRYLAILNRTLHLVDGRPGGVYLPVDFFFRSLAQDQKERA